MDAPIPPNVAMLIAGGDVRGLVEALASKDTAVQEAAAVALRDMGEPANR